MFYASIIFEIFAYKYDFFVQLVQSILRYNRGILMQNVLLKQVKRRSHFHLNNYV